MTQVHLIGNIGISELVILLIAPFVYIRDKIVLARDGFNPILLLLALTCFGCCFSSWYNHTILFNLLRGIASPLSFMSSIIVSHRLIRRDLGNLKWILLGLAVTNLLNIFAFQTGQSGDGAINGEYGDAAEIVMSNKLFWVSRIKAVACIPIQCCYLSTPFLYSFATPLLLTVFAIMSTDSGRSAALGSIVSCAIIFIGRNKVQSMLVIKKCFALLFIATIVGGYCVKTTYSILASNGTLGEKARHKYERQTHGNSSLLSILMGGRKEFFVAVMACLKHPIVGFGPWALDTEGYYEEFLYKYGSPEDVEEYVRLKWNAERYGNGMRVGFIPAHSHIGGFWAWYGIFGLLVWVYILWLMVQFFRTSVAAVPQWFGYFSLSIPSAAWGIFFGPFQGRVGWGVLVAAILMARNVAKKRISLPVEMQTEIYKRR